MKVAVFERLPLSLQISSFGGTGLKLIILRIFAEFQIISLSNKSNFDTYMKLKRLHKQGRKHVAIKILALFGCEAEYV